MELGYGPLGGAPPAALPYLDYPGRGSAAAHGILSGLVLTSTTGRAKGQATSPTTIQALVQPNAKGSVQVKGKVAGSYFALLSVIGTAQAKGKLLTTAFAAVLSRGNGQTTGRVLAFVPTATVGTGKGQATGKVNALIGAFLLALGFGKASARARELDLHIPGNVITPPNPYWIITPLPPE